jgi:hypothetical protein
MAAQDPGSDRDLPSFAHASEAEMARILDFYAVRWNYEPVTFPILWNLDGDVVESFSPDFYLPDLDLFLEMTTLKQRLVRKKNRKLRRLRELYPDVRIKLFYARDFRAMMLKYGRFGLVASLSGTLGQLVPDRSEQPPLALEVVAAAVAELEAVAELPEPVEVPRVEPELPRPPRASSPSGASGASASRARRRRRLAAAKRAQRVADGAPETSTPPQRPDEAVR